jgi:tRNA dimethylallyltransferase
VHGNEFIAPPDDFENRKRLMQLDAAYLHRLLHEADPASAAAIHPNNIKRVARALSFHQTTGQRFSEHNRRQKQNEPVFDTAFIVLDSHRPALYERINKRTEEMVKNGLIDEVGSLLEKGYHPSLPAMQGIGYKETVTYLHGGYNLGEMITAVQQATRQYAKRQITWFTHQSAHGRRVGVDGKTAAEIAAEIIKLTCERG